MEIPDIDQILGHLPAPTGENLLITVFVVFVKKKKEKPAFSCATVKMYDTRLKLLSALCKHSIEQSFLNIPTIDLLFCGKNGVFSKCFH